MADSDIAHSPAISTLTTDFVDQMLAGSTTWNIAAAVGVATGYGLLMLAALFNFCREKHRSHLLLVLFGALRVVAFSVRARMQKHLTQNLAIVYEVFFAVGFVALVKLLLSLLMAWSLPDARLLAQGLAQGKTRRSILPSLTLLRNHGSFQERFTFLALIVGAICSIIGATDAYDAEATVKQYNKGLALMRAGYTIYLAVIGFFCLLCIFQPWISFSSRGLPTGVTQSTTAKKIYMSAALLLCGLCLACKSVFQVIAIYVSPSLTFRNKLFYSLEVCPELLVFLILVLPGFIHMYLEDHTAIPLTTKDNVAYKEPETGKVPVTPIVPAEAGV